MQDAKQKSQFMYLENFLPEKLIEYCRQLSEKMGRHDSKVGNTVQKNKKRRKDVFLSVRQCAEVDKYIFSKRDYFEKEFGVQIAYRETYKVGIYDSQDKGFYIPHTDTQGGMGHRKLSLVACLSSSDDYTGGVFKFLNLEKAFKFNRGDAIIFNPELLHGVEPVESGNRRVLISFMWDEAGEKARIAKTGNPNNSNYKVGGMDTPPTPKAPLVEVPPVKGALGGGTPWKGPLEGPPGRASCRVVSCSAKPPTTGGVLPTTKSTRGAGVCLAGKRGKPFSDRVPTIQAKPPTTRGKALDVPTVIDAPWKGLVSCRVVSCSAAKMLACIPPDSGPGNQVVAIKEALIIAKLTGRKMLIPPIRSHYLVSNTKFWPFSDIYCIVNDNSDALEVTYDTERQTLLDSLPVDRWYTIHANYRNKVLRHQQHLKRKGEILLKRRAISTTSDVSAELGKIKSDAIVIKHIFNNLAISKCRINGCFTCPLNPQFAQLYRQICSKIDFSNQIKTAGDKFISQHLGGGYTAVHLRLPDIMYNKELSHFTNDEVSVDKIYQRLEQLLEPDHSRIFLATNGAKYLSCNEKIRKAIATGKIVLYSDEPNARQNNELDSFIEQYLCCQSSDFYYLVVDGVRYKKPHCRSTFTSFIIDYRNFFLAKPAKKSKPLFL